MCVTYHEWFYFISRYFYYQVFQNHAEILNHRSVTFNVHINLGEETCGTLDLNIADQPGA